MTDHSRPKGPKPPKGPPNPRKGRRQQAGVGPANPTRKARERRGSQRALTEHSVLEGNIVEYPIIWIIGGPRD